MKMQRPWIEQKWKNRMPSEWPLDYELRTNIVKFAQTEEGGPTCLLAKDSAS